MEQYEGQEQLNGVNWNSWAGYRSFAAAFPTPKQRKFHFPAASDG